MFKSYQILFLLFAPRGEKMFANHIYVTLRFSCVLKTIPLAFEYMKVCRCERPITESVGFPDARRRVSNCNRGTRKSFHTNKFLQIFQTLNICGQQMFRNRSEVFTTKQFDGKKFPQKVDSLLIFSYQQAQLREHLPSI